MLGLGLLAIPVLIVCTFFASLFIYWGVKLAGISEATFGECIKISIVFMIIAAVVSVLAGLVVGEVPRPLSALGGFALEVLVIGAVFRTSFVKAAMASLYSYILMIVAFVGIFMLVEWFK